MPASIGLTCHLGPVGWVLSRGRAGTISVAGEEVCLGDRRVDHNGGGHWGCELKVPGGGVGSCWVRGQDQDDV